MRYYYIIMMITMCYKIKNSSEGKQTQVLFQLRNPRAPTLPRVSQV